MQFGRRSLAAARIDSAADLDRAASRQADTWLACVVALLGLDRLLKIRPIKRSENPRDLRRAGFAPPGPFRVLFGDF